MEHEIDMILQRKDVAKAAAKDWQTKWAPAIHAHSETLTGKLGALFKTNQKTCEGKYYHTSTYIQHAESASRKASEFIDRLTSTMFISALVLQHASVLLSLCSSVSCWWRTF